jgi:hypothetical protein
MVDADGVSLWDRREAKGGKLADRRLQDHLRLLSDCGAGLEAIAGRACVIARRLVEGDMAGIFWLDEQGAPAGFYHETDRVDLKDLFITRFDELFSGPDQENMMTLTAPIGPSIGRCLDPAYLDRFWRGNVYRYLCTPLDHHFMIDVRVEVGGIGRAVLLVWSKGRRSFSARDVERLRPVQAMLTRAWVERRPDARWMPRGSGNAHLITDIAGERLLAIDPEAEELLMRSHMLAQNVGMAARLRVAPAFARILAAALAAGPSAREVTPIANGRIAADARRSALLDEAGGDQPITYIALREETSFAACCIDHLMEQPLSPLQRNLALFGMKGGERADCSVEFGISAEALKKHSAAIVKALGVARWTDLTALADQIARRT